MATFTFGRFTDPPWREAEFWRAWRWYYRDPQTGEQVGPSPLMTPTEVAVIDPQAQAVPDSVEELPVVITWSRL